MHTHEMDQSAEALKVSPRSLADRRLRARIGLPARKIGRKVVFSLRPREVIRKLEAAGFRLRRQTGSHARYVRPDNRKVTVPIHSRDIAVPTLRSILRQVHVSPEEWQTLWGGGVEHVREGRMVKVGRRTATQTVIGNPLMISPL